MNRRRIESFLLRLVVADQNSANPQIWRGRIQHVGSGYERQFEHLQELVTFINEHLDADLSTLMLGEEPMSAEH